MGLATNILPTITDTITTYGSDITLKKKGSSAYNPSTGKVETTLGTETQMKAVIDSFTAEEIGGLIQVGDIKVVTAYDSAITYDIATDKIVFNSTEYSLINIEPSIFQNQVMAYEIQIRK